MTSFFLWNLKGDILILFHTKRVNGDWLLHSKNGKKTHLVCYF